MTYGNIKEGIFRSRPNRFIAMVEVDGVEKVCHVKNTGRCRELLTDGARVILSHADNSARKTEYDLIAVYKGEKLINIDSQAPNTVLGEWLKAGGIGGLTLIKPERFYKNSRFDFYVESGEEKMYIEVKGVTLEDNGEARFPDAPTSRGAKHLRELTDAVENGYRACVFFVVQMMECKHFTPNDGTDPQFAAALRAAAKSGVSVRALNCEVAENGLKIHGDIPVIL